MVLAVEVINVPSNTMKPIKGPSHQQIEVSRGKEEDKEHNLHQKEEKEARVRNQSMSDEVCHLLVRRMHLRVEIGSRIQATAQEARLANTITLRYVVTIKRAIAQEETVVGFCISKRADRQLPVKLKHQDPRRKQKARPKPKPSQPLQLWWR